MIECGEEKAYELKQSEICSFWGECETYISKLKKAIEEMS